MGNPMPTITDVPAEQFAHQLGRRIGDELDRILIKLGFDAANDEDWLRDNLVAFLLPDGEMQYCVAGLVILEVIKLEAPRYGFEIKSHF
ncbi:MAG: hypothetical protein ACYST6_19630 [Planctomycetota bacterium]|jgi:hypothetical protein